MKRKSFFISLIALFAFGLTFTSCNKEEQNNNGIYSPDKKIASIERSIPSISFKGSRDDNRFQNWFWKDGVLDRIEDVEGFIGYKFIYDDNNVLQEVLINTDTNYFDDDNMVARYNYNDGVINKISVFKLDFDDNEEELEYEILFKSEAGKIVTITYIEHDDYSKNNNATNGDISRYFNEVTSPIISVLMPNEVSELFTRNIQKQIENNSRKGDIEFRLELFYDENNNNLTKALFYDEDDVEAEVILKFLEYDNKANPYFGYLNPNDDNDLLALNLGGLSKNNVLKIEIAETNDGDKEYYERTIEYNGDFPSKIVTKYFEIEENGELDDLEIESIYWFTYL